MATNLNEFSQEVDAANPRVRRQAAKLQRDLTLRFIEIVAEATPFRTGHAQSNWIASRGSPDTEETFDEPLSILEIVTRSHRALRGLKFGESTFAQDNAEYISFLNEGTSAQAPAGFIEVALAITADIFGVVLSTEDDDGLEDAA